MWWIVKITGRQKRTIFCSLRFPPFRGAAEFQIGHYTRWLLRFSVGENFSHVTFSLLRVHHAVIVQTHSKKSKYGSEVICFWHILNHSAAARESDNILHCSGFWTEPPCCLQEEVCSLPALTHTSGIQRAHSFPVATGCYSWTFPLCVLTAQCFQDTPATRLMVRSRSATVLISSRCPVTLNHSLLIKLVARHCLQSPLTMT